MERSGSQKVLLVISILNIIGAVLGILMGFLMITGGALVGAVSSSEAASALAGSGLTQGELTAFTNYMTQILLALVVLANLIVTFTKAFAAASRVSEVFEILPEESGDLVPEERPDVPVIEFRGVSFTYEGAGDSSLRNVSFSLGRGQTLGVIGGTGSGKSTLSSLIPGFYRPTEGEVLVKGLSTVEWRLNCLRRTIGYVPQKAVLFS